MTEWTNGSKTAIKLHGCCSIGYIVMSDHSYIYDIKLAWVTSPAAYTIEVYNQDENIIDLLMRSVFSGMFDILI